MMQVDFLKQEKYFIKMMILNSYINAGWWCYSLEDNELERYIDKLKELFINNGFSGELFLKDLNGEYSNYKNYLLFLFNGDDSSLGYYNKCFNEVAVSLDYMCFSDLLEIVFDSYRTFIEWGSYYITDCSMESVFEANRESYKLVKKRIENKI